MKQTMVCLLVAGVLAGCASQKPPQLKTTLIDPYAKPKAVTPVKPKPVTPAVVAKAVAKKEAKSVPKVDTGSSKVVLFPSKEVVKPVVKLPEYKLPPVSPLPPLVAPEQMPYFSVLSGWAREKGFDYVAWDLPKETMEVLAVKTNGKKEYHNSISISVSQLAADLRQPIYLHLDHTNKIASFTSWSTPTTAMLVKGASLKEALKGVTLRYGWNWLEDKEAVPSYKASSDYKFSAPYAIATYKGDVSTAFMKVLENYPVVADLHDGTRTVFLKDEK